MIRSVKPIVLLAGFSLALSGCDSATGPGADAETHVLLSRSSGASQALASYLVAPLLSATPSLYEAAAAAGPVSLSNVASVEVTITRVDALPAQQDTTTEGAWISLQVGSPVSANLLTLPTATEGGITLARGELSPGTYGFVRFFVTSPTITFKEPVRVGRQVYPANEKIPLFIPSAEETGLKTQISFTVSDDGGAEIKIVWDAAASVDRIIATGANKIILPPVLGADARGGR